MLFRTECGNDFHSYPFKVIDLISLAHEKNCTVSMQKNDKLQRLLVSLIKVKVKLSLCLTKHHAIWRRIGEWRYSSTHS